jgi:hypothetical protein
VRSIIFLFCAILSLLANACKPKSQCVSAGGGKGGTVVISVSPTHLDGYVDSCTVYIKYGSLDAPANGIYDDSVICSLADTIPVARFTNLKAGLYFFYGKGYHIPYTAYVKGAVNYTACTEVGATLLLPTYSYNP